MFSYTRSRSGCGSGAKSAPQQVGPTPNFPRSLWNRAPQTIFVLKKWQIRPRPLCVYVNIPAVAECQNPPASAPQLLRAYVNVTYVERSPLGGADLGVSVFSCCVFLLRRGGCRCRRRVRRNGSWSHFSVPPCAAVAVWRHLSSKKVSKP